LKAINKQWKADLALQTLLPVVLISSSASAQDRNLPTAQMFDSNNTTAQANIVGVQHLLSSFEFWLSVVIVLFAVSILSVEFYMIFRAKHIIFRPDDVLRLIITTLVVFGTLFFLAAGFSSEQIAPAVGLFGTVVGYLLGSSDRLRSTSVAGGTHAEEAPINTSNSS
jgi:hypothetical protein